MIDHCMSVVKTPGKKQSVRYCIYRVFVEARAVGSL